MALGTPESGDTKSLNIIELTSSIFAEVSTSLQITHLSLEWKKICSLPYRGNTTQWKAEGLDWRREGGKKEILRPPYLSPPLPQKSAPSPTKSHPLGRREEEKHPKALTLEAPGWNGPARWTVFTDGRVRQPTRWPTRPELLISGCCLPSGSQTRHLRKASDLKHRGFASGVQGQVPNTPNLQ